MVAYLLLSNLTSKTIFKKHIHRPSISIYFNRRAERGKLTGVNGTQGVGVLLCGSSRKLKRIEPKKVNKQIVK